MKRKDIVCRSERKVLRTEAGAGREREDNKEKKEEYIVEKKMSMKKRNTM